MEGPPRRVRVVDVAEAGRVRTLVQPVIGRDEEDACDVDAVTTTGVHVVSVRAPFLHMTDGRLPFSDCCATQGRERQGDSC